MDRVHLVRQLVDEDPVVLLQRRGHRFRRDVEGLEQERLDEQRDGQRADDEDPPLERGQPRSLVLRGWRTLRRLVVCDRSGLLHRRPARSPLERVVGFGERVHQVILSCASTRSCVRSAVPVRP